MSAFYPCFIAPPGSCVLRRSYTWMRIRIPGQIEQKLERAIIAFADRLAWTTISPIIEARFQ